MRKNRHRYNGPHSMLPIVYTVQTIDSPSIILEIIHVTLPRFRLWSQSMGPGLFPLPWPHNSTTAVLRINCNVYGLHGFIVVLVVEMWSSNERFMCHPCSDPIVNSWCRALSIMGTQWVLSTTFLIDLQKECTELLKLYMQNKFHTLTQTYTIINIINIINKLLTV